MQPDYQDFTKVLHMIDSLSGSIFRQIIDLIRQLVEQTELAIKKAENQSDPEI